MLKKKDLYITIYITIIYIDFITNNNRKKSTFRHLLI